MVKTSKIQVLLKTCLAYIHSITCLSFAGRLAPEELSFLAGTTTEHVGSRESLSAAD